MNDTQVLSPLQIEINQAFAKATNQLSRRSIRIYANDARAFATWLADHGGQITQEAMTEYRNHLADRAYYAPATGKRMWSVARRIVLIQIARERVPENALDEVKGIQAEDESPHIALSKEQARQLLAAIPRDTHRGVRDYALVSLLLYTGLRRFECAALKMSDMGMDQGHHVLWVLGKGNKRQKVKLRVEVWRAIQDYLADFDHLDAASDAPLFVQTQKGNKITDLPLGPTAIERLIVKYAEVAGIDGLTPHGLRASFITLALEGRAKLEQVQYAARHKNPATTERYQRRKDNLDDNAVDYIKL